MTDGATLYTFFLLKRFIKIEKICKHDLKFTIQKFMYVQVWNHVCRIGRIRNYVVVKYWKLIKIKSNNATKCGESYCFLNQSVGYNSIFRIGNFTGFSGFRVIIALKAICSAWRSTRVWTERMQGHSPQEAFFLHFRYECTDFFYVYIHLCGL